jgi:hypothetical protein
MRGKAQLTRAVASLGRQTQIGFNDVIKTDTLNGGCMSAFARAAEMLGTNSPVLVKRVSDGSPRESKLRRLRFNCTTLLELMARKSPRLGGGQAVGLELLE